MVIVPKLNIEIYISKEIDFNTNSFSNNKSDGRGAKALAMRNISINSPLFFVFIELSKYFKTAFNDAGVWAETNASINVNLQQNIDLIVNRKDHFFTWLNSMLFPVLYSMLIHSVVLPMQLNVRRHYLLFDYQLMFELILDYDHE